MNVEEEFEEFEEEVEEDEAPEPKVELKVEKAKKKDKKGKVEEVKTSEQPPQYVGVPRVVTSAELLNLLYEGHQEIKQALSVIYEGIQAIQAKGK
jgi:hypothetical protein